MLPIFQTIPLCQKRDYSHLQQGQCFKLFKLLQLLSAIMTIIFSNERQHELKKMIIIVNSTQAMVGIKSVYEKAGK